MKKIIALTLIFMAGIQVFGQTADAQTEEQPVIPAWLNNFSLSAWGRGVVTPLAMMGEHSAVSAATFTSSDTPSLGFTVKGHSNSNRIGFQFDLGYGGGVAGIGDNAKVWVRPWNAITLTTGWFKEEDFRGRIGASEFAGWLLPSSGKGEDNIFTRFDASAGAHLKLLPLLWFDSPWNALTLEAMFGSNALGSPANSLRAIYNFMNNEDNNTLIATRPDEDRTVTFLDVYKAAQIGLAYRLPEIGMIRAQFIGNNRNVLRWIEENNQVQYGQNGQGIETKLMRGLNNNRDADVIEGAFLLDGVKGIVIDVGAKIPLEFTTNTQFVIYDQVLLPDVPATQEEGGAQAGVQSTRGRDYTIQMPYSLAIGARWNPSFFDRLTLTARVDISFGGHIEGDVYEVATGYNVNAWLMPAFKILDNVTAGIDLAIDTHGEDTFKLNGKTDKEQGVLHNRTEASVYTDFGIGPWVELQVGGGRIRTGVTIMLPDSPRYKYVRSATGSSQTNIEYSPLFTGDPVISVPISFTYSF
jgi:hypothetical protein